MELMLKDWQREDMALWKGLRQLRLGTSKVHFREANRAIIPRWGN